MSESRSDPAGRLARWSKDPAFRFVGWFVLCLAVGQIAYYQIVTPSRPFQLYVRASCRGAAALLRAVGEPVEVSGDEMTGGFSMSVRNGCDGLQAVGILIIAIMIFPGPLKKKLLGATLGAAVIVLLNVLRIASLFWFGAHRPEWFQAMHVHIWPALLIFAALLFWIAWETGTGRPPEAARS